VETTELRRVVTWTVAGLFAFAVVSEVTYKRPATPPRVLTEGQDVDVGITLVATDAKALSCSSTEDLDGRHCEFQSRTERWSKPWTSGRPPQADVLAPYKTTDDVLLLVPGLFSEQALRQRLAIDPPVFGQEHSRFVANCKMHVEGKLKQADVRWATQGAWQPQKDVWVGTVTSCWLSDG